MKEFEELKPNAEFLFNKRHQDLLDSNILALVVNHSGITSGKHTLEIDMGFKGKPEVVWDICRKRRNESSRIEVNFDGSILTIRSREIHFKGTIPLEEKERDLALGKAIRNSFECW